jgi:hypothetical protein
MGIPKTIDVCGFQQWVYLSHSVFEGAVADLPNFFAAAAVEARQNLIIIETELFRCMPICLCSLKDLIDQDIGIAALSGASRQCQIFMIRPPLEKICRWSI